MREPIIETIDGVTFEVTPLGYKAQRAAFVRLSKALGPALAALADKAPNLASINLVGAVTAAVEGVSDDDLEWAAETFGEATRFWSSDPTRKPFLRAQEREALFGERGLVLFFKWLALCLRANFAPFFVALSGSKGA